MSRPPVFFLRVSLRSCLGVCLWVFLALITLAVFVGCASTEKETTETPVPKRPAPQPKESIDLKTLQRRLHLDRSVSELGFEEKRFRPCNHGIAAANCEASSFFVVIHFQLQCRDVDGTVETYNVEPIKNERLRWRLGNRIEGVVKTDHEGFGQLITMSGESMRGKKLRLTLNNDFLIVNAEEARRIVTPPMWCASLAPNRHQ